MKNTKQRILKLVLMILPLIFIISTIYLMKEKILTLAMIQARAYEIRGIDVSHFQGNIDWEILSQENIHFAFIKATEGSSHIDPKFLENFREASQTDLCIGAYHFFSFASEGERQAEHYIEVVGDLNGKMPPIIDFEFYPNQGELPSDEEVRSELQTLLVRLEDEYGVKPIIYATTTTYKLYIENYFLEYPIWIRNVYYKTTLEPGRDWSFWQYQDNAKLEGYSGEEERIDLNVFAGTIEQLHEMKVK